MQRNKDQSSSVTAVVAYSVGSAIHRTEVLSTSVKAEGVPRSQKR
jgi:hypothetical protein